MNTLSVQHEASSSVAPEEDDARTVFKPSAKALGKRKVVDVEPPER
jgi:hypothetical protein